ncbi:MAG: hypothetical protein ACLQGV_11810 [Bryobacteraceae bacterium]
MPGFKQVLVSSEKGTVLAYEPIVLSFPLAPLQREAVNGATGHYPAEIHLTASELREIVSPRDPQGRMI